MDYDLKNQAVQDNTKLIIDTMPLAVIVIDVNNAPYLCNKVTLSLFGITSLKELSALSPPLQPTGDVSM